MKSLLLLLLRRYLLLLLLLLAILVTNIVSNSLKRLYSSHMIDTAFRIRVHGREVLESTASAS